MAKFHSIYRVGESKPDTKDTISDGLPDSEASKYNGEHAVFNLTKIDYLVDVEAKLTIDWGNSARMWHQKGMTEKPIISIQPDNKMVFTGFEYLVKTYDDHKEIVENPEVYEAWHTASFSVYAMYLTVDTETGKQYVGSAYRKDGLLGRWSVDVQTRHGNNKEMKQVICNHPDKFHAFQFSVLQILPKTVTDEEVIHIENLWKQKLLSTRFGMNDN